MEREDVIVLSKCKVKPIVSHHVNAFATIHSVILITWTNDSMLGTLSLSTRHMHKLRPLRLDYVVPGS